MANSGLLGPYPLEEKYIERFVTNSADWSSASVFALGKITNKRKSGEREQYVKMGFRISCSIC